MGTKCSDKNVRKSRTKFGDINMQEPIGDYQIRIWKECRDETGIETVFLNYCIQNYPNIVDEFMQFDAMMSGE